MMRAAALLFGVAAAAFVVTGTVTSYAADARDAVVFRDDPKARERDIVTKFFGIWLDGNKEARIETGLADLNGDGTAEIFARLIDKSTCDGDLQVCRTMALMFDGHAWTAVFDRPSASIEIGKPGRDKMRDIMANGANGGEARVWNGHAYVADLANMKTTSPKFGVLAPAKEIELSRGFGNAAEKLVTAKRASVMAATVDLGDRQATVVRLEGAAACGDYVGCPIRVLVADDTGRQVPILEATTRDDNGAADFYILPVIRGGWRSLAVKMPNGTPLVADWDGKRYVLEARQ